MLSLVGDALVRRGATSCCAHTKTVRPSRPSTLRWCARTRAGPTQISRLILMLCPSEMSIFTQPRHSEIQCVVCFVFVRAPVFVDEHGSASTRFATSVLILRFSSIVTGAALSLEIPHITRGRLSVKVLRNGLSLFNLSSSLWTFVTRDVICSTFNSR